MRRNILHKMEGMLFRFYHRFNFLTVEDIDGYLDELERKIRVSGYEPEIVVAVMRDGLYPARKIAERLKADMAIMRVNHYAIPFGRFEIDDIVGLYRLARKLGYKPRIEVTQDLDKDVSNKRVLIVDDDSYSEATLNVAANHIKSKEPETVRTAVLLTHDENSAVDYAGCTLPKGVLHEMKYRMPWAKFSPNFMDVNGSQ